MIRGKGIWSLINLGQKLLTGKVLIRYMNRVYAMCCAFTPTVIKGRIPMQVDIGVGTKMLDEILWNIFGILTNAMVFGLMPDAVSVPWCKTGPLLSLQRSRITSDHQKRQEPERRLKAFLGDHNMHFRRRNKTRVFEGCATKLGGGDCAVEQTWRKRKGDKQDVLGRVAEATWLTRERDGLAVEGVFDESHVADVRLFVRLAVSSPQPDGRASSSSL